ncbi:isoprenoid synthase domain-containing protein [Triangularia verruculosa]|uniref:Isoprenoid synthase domain-containing protein n=1 Tax=Triangularia verruculosa TaxID=2587418 RepID=A0AAN6XQA4_9PEZI|nr:isoprenoid synthase domain-containing protein [Triangularia verruculosa]
MEFRYSSIVDLPVSQTLDLSLDVPIRVHKSKHLEDYGAIKAQHYWAKNIGHLPLVDGSPVFKGSIGPQTGAYISFVNEFEFLYDDWVEAMEQTESDARADARVEVFNLFEQFASAPPQPSAVSDLESASSPISAIKKIQTNLIRQAFEIDRPCASWTVKIWSKWAEHGMNRQRDAAFGFTKLEDYYDYRYHEIGTALMMFQIAFGMGLMSPEEEHELLFELHRPAWISIALANDIFSYEKGRRLVESLDKSVGYTEPSNAIPIAMRLFSVDLETAHAVARAEAKKYAVEYIRNFEVYKNRKDLSVDFKKYLEAMLYAISGNIGLSLDVPKYNPERTYNERQLEWMSKGVPDRRPSVGIAA